MHPSANARLARLRRHAYLTHENVGLRQENDALHHACGGTHHFPAAPRPTTAAAAAPPTAAIATTLLLPPMPLTAAPLVATTTSTVAAPPLHTPVATGHPPMDLDLRLALLSNPGLVHLNPGLVNLLGFHDINLNHGILNAPATRTSPATFAPAAAAAITATFAAAAPGGAAAARATMHCGGHVSCRNRMWLLTSIPAALATFVTASRRSGVWPFH